MNILHLDVDENIRPLLTVPKKVSPDQIECITCKSQTHLTSSRLQKYPKLKLVVARTVGTDNIDLAYCKRNGIAVYHIPDYGSGVVAQHTLALLLAGARRIVQADQAVHIGSFSYEPFLGKSLTGKTVGVIGTGRIGQAFIKLLVPFGVNILVHDVVKNARLPYVPLRELLRKSDIVSIHVPLVSSTNHLIGKKELELMKPGSILVNTSRGAIIDEKALIQYIKKFSVVCLDVVENEDKFTKKNPLLKFENVIITPHIGFYTDESIMRIAAETKKCIINYEKGNKEGKVI